MSRAVALAVATALTVATAVTPAHADADPEVRWAPCADVIGVPVDPAKADCAVYEVPVRHPNGGTLGIRMLRRKATDPDRRIGSLFVNPGGPGTSGLHVAYRAERFLAPEVVARYDVIGFDPRGVGQSEAVKCFESQEQHDATFAGRVAVPATAAEEVAAMAASRAYVTLCAANAGALLPHLTTVNVARDLDLLRRAVGDERLRFVGMSYGTLIGATYANLYPDRVGAMVLDGNVDPPLRMTDGLEYDRQRAEGYELALDAYFAACAQAVGCAFRGGDGRAKLGAILSRLRAGPVTLPDGQPLTLSTFTTRLADGLGTAKTMPDLARWLAEVHAVVSGVPTGARGRPTAALAGATTPYRSDDSENGFNCLDKPYPPVPAAWPALADGAAARSPVFGRMVTYESAPCASWPAPWWRAERYSGPWDRRSANPVLVVGNRYDAVTRYEFSRRMAIRLASARLLTVDAFGHTALGLNRCADAATTQYLLHGRLPEPGARCAADDPLFP